MRTYLVLPRQEPVQRDTFTEDEILRLRADADVGDETSMIILILIYTGYRINELLQKRRDQVDLDLDVMYGGEKTAAGRGRVVVIHPKIRPYVEYFAARATGPLLRPVHRESGAEQLCPTGLEEHSPASGDHQGRPAAPSPLHPLHIRNPSKNCRRG